MLSHVVHRVISRQIKTKKNTYYIRLRMHLSARTNSLLIFRISRLHWELFRFVLSSDSCVLLIHFVSICFRRYAQSFYGWADVIRSFSCICTLCHSLKMPCQQIFYSNKHVTSDCGLFFQYTEKIIIRKRLIAKKNHIKFLTFLILKQRFWRDLDDRYIAIAVWAFRMALLCVHAGFGVKTLVRGRIWKATTAKAQGKEHINIYNNKYIFIYKKIRIKWRNNGNSSPLKIAALQSRQLPLCHWLSLSNLSAD